MHVGSLQFQPGELAKIMLIVFLAGYLREKREVLAQGRLKDFGPLLLIWGARDARARRDERPRLRRSSTSGSSSRCSTSPRRGCSFVAAGLGALPRRRGGVYHSSPACRSASRSGSTRGPTTVYGPTGLRRTASYQLVQSLYSIAHGGFGGTGLGHGTFTTDERTRS